MKNNVQKILNKYRLRINGNKTEVHLCAEKTSTTNIKALYRACPYLDLKGKSHYSFEMDDLFDLKQYIAKCKEEKCISQIKSLLTQFTNSYKQRKLSFKYIEYEVFSYFWKLIGIDEKLSVHVYRLLDVMLDFMASDVKQDCLNDLLHKTRLINEKWNDGITQIWHYYVLIKHKNGFKDDLISKLDMNDLNPIIVAMLVNVGCESNKNLMQYIFKTYSSEVGVSINECKNTIMFSKWWLPIYNIASNDKYNYYELINSELYPDILSLINIDL